MHEERQYSAQNLASFRQTYLQAIDEELAAGRLGKIRAWSLRRVADNERRLQRLANEVAAEYESAGHSFGNAAGVAAPDWSALLSFIKELLPLIAQLISMFRV